MERCTLQAVYFFHCGRTQRYGEASVGCVCMCVRVFPLPDVSEQGWSPGKRNKEERRKERENPQLLNKHNFSSYYFSVSASDDTFANKVQ